MTAAATTKEFLAIEDAKTITSAVNILKQEFVSCYPSEVDNTSQEENQNIEKLFNMTNMSIKMYSKSYYKKSASLDTIELEQIKNALENYKNNNERVKNFKNEIIENLTSFQQQIRTNHVQKIVELRKEQKLMEKECAVLNVEKHKLIMDRLSKILWPYDEKTKQYDARIAATELKIKRLAQRAEELEAARPSAKEKDILLYQMQLKEKYAQVK